MVQNTNPEQERNQLNQPERAERVSRSSQTSLSPEQKKQLEILCVKEDLQDEIIKIERIRDEKTREEEKTKYFADIKKIYGTLLGASFEKLKMTLEDKKVLKELKDKAKEKIDEDTKKLRHDLLNSIPEKCFEGWETEKEQKCKEESGQAVEFPISLEKMRVILHQRLPEELRPIFQELFLLKLDLSNWKGVGEEDQIVPPPGDSKIEKVFDPQSNKNKFRLTIDPTGCMREESFGEGAEKVTLYFFSENRFVYQIMRAMLVTIKGENKKDFEDWCQKNGFGKKIDKNDKTKSDDWLAMMLSDFQKCREKVDPRLKEAYEKWLKKFKKLNVDNFTKPSELSETISIKSLELDDTIIENRIYNPWRDKETDTHISGPGLYLLENFGILGKMLYTIGATVGNINKLIDRQYIHMFLAEEDAKEMKKLLLRDISGSDYIPMLKNPIYYQNKDKMRALLLTIASKGYYQWWMAQFYLFKHDGKFRSTHGKEITHDGYDFICRLTKMHQKAIKGPAMAIPEYKEVAGKFVRRSYDEQIGIIDGVMETMPLWQVQHILPDALDLLRVENEYIDLDTKLGEYDKDPDQQKYNKDKKHFCATDNKMLEKFLPVEEAEKFFLAMKDYAQNPHNLNEPEFNNLVGPGIKSLVRRLKKAATEDREIFSAHTSPLMRQLFKEYQSKVGDAKYTIKEYESDFSDTRKKIEDHNFDLEETIKDYSFEEICQIYDNFSRDRNISPYMRGDQITPRGKLEGFLEQAKERIISNARSKNIPEEIRDFIAAEIERIEEKRLISDDDISNFRKLFEEKTSRLEDKAKYSLGADLDKFFIHLKNLGVVKRYQRLFASYAEKLNYYLAPVKEERIDLGKLQKANNYFQEEIAYRSDQTSTGDKIKAIGWKFPQIKFSPKEIDKIESLATNEEKNLKISHLLIEKINELSRPKNQQLNSDYEKLNQLYYEVNEFIANGEKKYNLDELKNTFKTLNLIPDEVKSKSIPTLLDLRKYLQLAKAVVNSYYTEENKRKLKRRHLGIVESALETERESEIAAMEDEEAAVEVEEA